MQLAQTHSQILGCYPAMRELRPHLTSPEAFLAQVLRQQQAHGYQLAYVEAEGQAAAVAGYRYGEFLAWGKIVYIDDLVTMEHARGRGLADQLISGIVEFARASGCASVQLDSGYQRHDAHRFYLRHGFRMTSHHFSLPLPAV